MNQLDMFGEVRFAPTPFPAAPETECDWARQRRLLAALLLWPDKPRQWFSLGR